MTKKTWDAIWINAMIATCAQGYGLIAEGAIAVKDKKIAWVGAMKDLPAEWDDTTEKIYDVQGKCLTPGLIDCHTHLVFAGNRSHEFEMRLQGVSYEDIARQGGGIVSTVKATRAVSEKELLRQSLKRARALRDSGATTIEIKSGYGLDTDAEFKMLRVAKQIEEQLSISVRRTFLGAHCLPPDYDGDKEAYIQFICAEMLPKIGNDKLADSVDVFCEKIAFTLPQTERVFKAAQEYGLPVKCHSEQLSDSNSAQLAAQYGALSVDHLEHVSEEGVKALVQAGTVAVLLPGAFYFLRETKLPPVDLLRQYSIPIAIASDCNPGTSPITSLTLVMNMACVLFRLTPEEALLGVTLQAAKALGINADYGSLEIGKQADLAVWDVTHPAELAYYAGLNPLEQLVKGGEILLS